MLFHLDGSEHRVVDDVHVVGVDAFGNQCGTLDVFDFLHTLYLGEDEVGIAAHSHRTPCLIVVVVLLQHQFHGFMGMLVVELHRLLWSHIDFIDKAPL